MSPTMTKVACGADFIQADITYDDCREYPYIFNAVTLITLYIFRNTQCIFLVMDKLRKHLLMTMIWSLLIN